VACTSEIYYIARHLSWSLIPLAFLSCSICAIWLVAGAVGAVGSHTNHPVRNSTAMVSIQKKSAATTHHLRRFCAVAGFGALALIALGWIAVVLFVADRRIGGSSNSSRSSGTARKRMRAGGSSSGSVAGKEVPKTVFIDPQGEKDAVLSSESVDGERKIIQHTEKKKKLGEGGALSGDDPASSCSYKSLDDLSPEERHPRAGTRFIVDPPSDTKLTLVCCVTTQGPWNIVAHHAWAPLGAQRFVDMIKNGYWSEEVPLMRCIRNFLCQFGLAGERSKQYKGRIQDDPQWLPAGPEHRQHMLKREDGTAFSVRRFPKGFFSYAGAGENSRDLQIFVALADNGALGGGSPWEVPWGELVGAESYETLDKIYTGYGDKGPSQGSLWKKDGVEQAKQNYPQLDWVQSCAVVDEMDVTTGKKATAADNVSKRNSAINSQ